MGTDLAVAIKDSPEVVVGDNLRQDIDLVTVEDNLA